MLSFVLTLSYDTVLFYTKDIRIKSRKNDIYNLGIYGKSLDLLKELKRVAAVFNTDFNKEKKLIILKEKGNSLAFFCIRKY